MNAPDQFALPDIQSAVDRRNLYINRVGVKSILYPVRIARADGGVAVAEQQASCEVYGLLKRPDENYVTERAYENPKFVEDLVRDIALSLDGDPRIRAYTLESENFESIHNHSAYAMIERGNGER